MTGPAAGAAAAPDMPRGAAAARAENVPPAPAAQDEGPSSQPRPPRTDRRLSGERRALVEANSPRQPQQDAAEGGAVAAAGAGGAGPGASGAAAAKRKFSAEDDAVLAPRNRLACRRGRGCPKSRSPGRRRLTSSGASPDRAEELLLSGVRQCICIACVTACS